MSDIQELKRKGRYLQTKAAHHNGQDKLPRKTNGESAVNKLTHKRLKFVVHKALGMGNKDAAIKAGYSPHSAYSQGSQLMQRPAIQAALQELKESMLDDVETVFKELYGIALTDTEVKGSDKLTAIKLLLDYAYKEDAANAPSQVVVVWEDGTPDHLREGLMPSIGIEDEADIEDAEVIEEDDV